MKILLHKIHDTPKSFDIVEKDIVCKGIFWRSGNHRVTIKGQVKGQMLLTCDRCGETYLSDIDEKFNIDAVDEAIKLDDSLDMVECLDGFVDFDMICSGEIKSKENEYHLCPECMDKDEIEIEF